MFGPCFAAAISASVNQRFFRVQKQRNLQSVHQKRLMMLEALDTDNSSAHCGKLNAHDNEGKHIIMNASSSQRMQAHHIECKHIFAHTR
jgi:hypothetical protein